jgi:transposase
MLTGQLFKAWHAYQQHHDRDQLTDDMTAIQAELRELLEHAANPSKRHRLHRRFANNLLKLWPALWTFVTTSGVTPTNNATERSLSASVTCRLQHRSLLTYLKDLLTANQTGGALPALL